MPRPVYIACSESISHDRDTGLVSLFHVIEGYTLFVARKGSEEEIDTRALAKPTFHCVVVWARSEDDDIEHEWQYEFLASRLGVERVVQSGNFKFSKLHHRFVTRFVVNFDSPESGDFVITNRIRRSDNADWLSQEYRIPVQIDISEELTAEEEKAE